MSIFGLSVSAPTDAQSAAWLMPRLGEYGTVGGLVPEGYERYERVLLSEEGTTEDDIAIVRELVAVTKMHTATPDLTSYAIWEGYGWEGTRSFYGRRGKGPVGWLRTRFVRRRGLILDERRSQRVREGLSGIPTFDLPHRRYYLLNGPIESAPCIESPNGWGPQVPDLWWPEDQAWMVATDTDFDCLYVGGTKSLMEDISTALPNRTDSVERSTPTY